jgi:hypothetical protein
MAAQPKKVELPANISNIVVALLMGAVSAAF